MESAQDTAAVAAPFKPMPLAERSEPFDGPVWVFEPKIDCYRVLAFLEAGRVRLVSRRGREFKSYTSLATALAKEISAKSAVLDGELAVLDERGRSVFAGMRSRRSPVLVAFDLLALDGDDLRDRPLVVRKATLRRILPERSAHMLYLQHVEQRGSDLFRVACEQDLEGIVAKRASDPYDVKRVQWIKIKNANYSQGPGSGRWGDRYS